MLLDYNFCETDVFCSSSYIIRMWSESAYQANLRCVAESRGHQQPAQIVNGNISMKLKFRNHMEACGKRTFKKGLYLKHQKESLSGRGRKVPVTGETRKSHPIHLVMSDNTKVRQLSGRYSLWITSMNTCRSRSTLICTSCLNGTTRVRLSRDRVDSLRGEGISTDQCCRHPECECGKQLQFQFLEPWTG